MMSLASDDAVDEADAQRVSRDKMERELMIAYSRRRPLVRPLDLSQATSTITNLVVCSSWFIIL